MKIKQAFTPLNLARGTIIVLFLALIRCISEVFRLQYCSISPLTIIDVMPFLVGALIAAVALLSMCIFLFLEKYKIVIVLFILALASLFFVKFSYHLP